MVNDQEWKKNLSSSSYENLYKTADVFENLLYHVRFTDLRTLQKMKELQMGTANFLVYTPSSLSEPILLPPEYWRHLKEVLLNREITEKLGSISPDTILFVIRFFEKTSWVLVSDMNTDVLLREAIEKNIPQKYTKVKAGTRLVGQGDKVSIRHLAMFQAVKKALSKNYNLKDPLRIVGNALLALLAVFLSGMYFRLAQKDIIKSVQKLSLVTSVFLLTLYLAKGIEYFLLHSLNPVVESIHDPIIVPYAAVILTVFFSFRVALYISALVSILLSVTLAVDFSHFILLNFLTALIAILSTKTLRKRKEVFAICGKCFLGALVLLVGFSLTGQYFSWDLLFHDIGFSCIFLILIAVLIIGTLPLLESFFNVMTDITLMEYMDPNHELLRRIMVEIPGTYQHSLVLGNLAEAAADSIGANGLFCRAATLYHDIGKLKNTYFFTENQDKGWNVHQLLTPVESAQVIISHVKEGEELAKKYGLPEPFIDVIREHHGTTRVYFFYCKELELKGGDPNAVDEKLFRYPGPKPHSKETAIVMIADAGEAASRSLSEYSESVLTDVITRVIKDKAEDGQFDECPITFEELNQIKKTMVKTLLMIYHARIKYPEKLAPYSH